jgi:POT family proton-dependent oligopeptide transporter
MPYFTRNQSVLFLSFFLLLERFCYYGVRAIIVLYMMDKGGLNMDTNEALSYYGWLTICVAFLPLPAGLITDLGLKQKNAILLGSLLSVVGYSCLLLMDEIFILLGAILFLLGSSFIRISQPVLLGRLYSKLDDKRNTAFLINYFFVNIGAFGSALIISDIGQKVGWSSAFGVVTLVSITALVLFFLFREKLELIETNEIEEKHDYESDAAYILDTFQSPQRINYSLGLPVILLISMASMAFWWIFEQQNSFVYHFLLEDIMDGQDNFQFLNSSITIITCILLLAYFSIRNYSPSIILMSISLFLIGAATYLTYYGINVPAEFTQTHLIIIVIMISFAEVIISAFAASYITRVSNINYSSTYFAMYLFLLGAGAKVFSYLYFEQDNGLLITASIVGIVFGGVLLVLNGKLKEWFPGI